MMQDSIFNKISMKHILPFGLFLLLGFGWADAQSIRDVDFKNFAYEVDYCNNDGDNAKLSVKDGKYFRARSEEEGSEDPMYFAVGDVEFGDLDGDGKEEAVIISLCNTGGTGNFTEAYVFSMKNGVPFRVVTLSGGDRAYGGLREAKIKNGVLAVTSNDVGEFGAACCPEFVVTNRYRMRNGKLSEFGKKEKRALYPAKTIKFKRGRFASTFQVTMAADENIKRFSVGAGRGQTLKVTTTSPKISLRLFKGDAEVITEDKSLIAKLNSNGEYVFEVSNVSEKNVSFSITVHIK
jgi:invasion protein IalB